MATTTDARDMFTNLPLEMLQEVAANLDVHNRLKLRTVFPMRQEDVVADLLGSALKTLYVSLTEVSILHFEKITASSFFAKRIDTLVYLPYVLPYRDRDDPDFVPERAAMSFDEYLNEEHGQRDFNLPEARRSYAVYRDIYEQHQAYPSYEHPGIDAKLAMALGAGLTRLKLHQMVVRPYIQAEGLNASSMMYEEEYANYEMAKTQGGPPRQDKVYQVAVSTVREHFWNWREVTETNVVLRALEKAAVQLRELKIGGLEDKEFMDLDMNYFGQIAPRGNGKREALRAIEDLTIGVHDSEDCSGPGPYASDWQTIAKSADKLQRLTVLVHWNRYARAWFPDDVSRTPTHYFLRVRNYEHLRTLNLQAESECLGFVDGSTLTDFVDHHSTSGVLREVTLIDIVTVDFADDRTRRKDRSEQQALITDGVRAFLEQMSKYTLDVFEMKIVYRGDEELGTYLCDNSLGWGSDKAHVSWFEDMASKYDVCLSEVGWKDGKKGWNFGEVFEKLENGIAIEF